MRSEISYRGKFGNFTNMWKLNNTILRNQWDKEKITKEIRKYFETENKITVYENLWDTEKAVLRGKFVAIY